MIVQTDHNGSRSHGMLAAVLAFMLVTVVALLPQKAFAFGACICDGCTCTATEFQDNMTTNTDLHMETRFDYFGMVVPIPFYAYGFSDSFPGFIEGEDQGTERIGEHQVFVWQLWFENFLPIWQDMSETLTTVVMWHTFAIGTLIDAKQQLEVQTLLQERTAEVHKRYQPSVGMCVFGTNIRSLAASERNSRLVSHTLNQRLVDRQLGTEGGSAVTGSDSDQNGRVRYFLEHVCDRFDNNRVSDAPNTGFANICETQPRDEGTVNLDLDFTRLVMNPRTLNVDFVNTGNPDNEWGTHVFNLAANLYGHKVPTIEGVGSSTQVGKQTRALDIRSAIAKRSIAQTSFSAIVGLKARGTENSGQTNTLQYMSQLLQELGLDEDEVAEFVGERPSYYAQLEILAKKIYQNPDFYRELYDKPENTKRKSVAMSAIGSMLDREMFDSQLRAEAMISQLLELKVIKAQDDVEDSFSRKTGR